jgi:hypothetical protein
MQLSLVSCHFIRVRSEYFFHLVCRQPEFVKFEVLTAVSMKTAGFWFVPLCRLV